MIWMIAMLGCRSGDPVDTGEALPPPPIDPAVVESVDLRRVQDHVAVLADEALGGRIPGSVGSRTAQDYLIGEMIEVGLQPIGVDGTYVFPYPNEPGSGALMLDQAGAVVPHATFEGLDLVGAIPGKDPDRAHELMVVMAHYDHLGVDASGDAYNGAFDNATAVGMNLEIARALTEAGVQFDRTLVFLFTDDEEFGLDGADAWIRDPSVSQEDVVFGVSTDPLGRQLLPDFGPIALMGLERSPGLADAWRSAARYVEGPVYFIHRDIIPVFSSDQDRFYDAETPALWFTNLGFSWYHTVDDTAETIDYRIVARDAALLMYALATIGDSDVRFAYEGPTEPKGAEALEAKQVFLDLSQSAYMQASDLNQAAFYVDQLDQVIAADSEDAVDDAGVLYMAALYFLLFDLPSKYPGEIPPPWPEGR